ncbi:MAG: CehA/McbA family metallohydrolase [Candidatus Eisenbacteria sp.]|nr:CehA/McbA family metallohydrolase [Candidatus Eisenbacteria bacterium]
MYCPPMLRHWLHHENVRPVWLPLFLVLLSTSLLATAAKAIEVEVQVVDILGVPIPARIHVWDAEHRRFPGYPDSALMSHGRLRGYFYTAGSFVMNVPAGVTNIVVGRGFEWRPVALTPNIQNDTLLTITLEHAFDLRSEGWYSGDSHVHTQHEPVDYPVSPAGLQLIARCEDLAQIWAMDQGHEFTGGPHEVSTPEATIYFSTEYRNDALGHVSLLGLKELIGFGCCWYPEAASPMLSDLRESWDPQWDEAMILTHPRTGADFFDDGGWPASGLGRELPVLGALDYLDGIDIAIYSNDPDVYLDDWYRLLSCGFDVPPGGSTDACVAAYWNLPAGGYRAYVKEEPGTDHDHARWVEGFKAGHSFVTNYPLIPSFSVNGVVSGDTLAIESPTAIVDIGFCVKSVLPLQTATIICNGNDALKVGLPGDTEGTVLDTTVQLALERSSWIALRVTGETDLWHAADPALFAHTAAVSVHLDGSPVRETGAAGYFLDWIDSLEDFVEIRDHWNSEEQHQQVLQRLDAARGVYRAFFVLPPDAFTLHCPAAHETLDVADPIQFDWKDAVDPEDGDRIQYTFEFAADSLLNEIVQSVVTQQSEYVILSPLDPDQSYWWRVTATDRGGNTSCCCPECSCFFVIAGPSGLDENTPGRRSDDGRDLGLALQLEMWPNPARSPVTFRLNPPGITPVALEVLDLTGRRVFRTEFTSSRGSGAPHPGLTGITWDGRDPLGRPVPSGCYWVRLLSRDPSGTWRTTGDAPLRTRLVVLR